MILFVKVRVKHEEKHEGIQSNARKTFIVMISGTKELCWCILCRREADV